MTVCGSSGELRVVDCDQPATRSWQRYASPLELDGLRAAGRIPAGETEAQLMAYGCDQHAAGCGLAEQTDSGQFVGTDLATVVHDATCQLPAEPGDCGVCATYREENRS